MATKTDKTEKTEETKKKEPADLNYKEAPISKPFSSLRYAPEPVGECITVYVNGELVKGVEDANIEEGWVTYWDGALCKKMEGVVRIISWKGSDVTSIPETEEQKAEKKRKADEKAAKEEAAKSA